MPELTSRIFLDDLHKTPKRVRRAAPELPVDDGKDFTWSLPSDGSGHNMERLGLGPRNTQIQKFAAAAGLPPIGRINNLLTGSVSGGLDKSLTKLPPMPNMNPSALGSTMPFGSMSVWGDTPFPKAVGAVNAPMASGMAQATGAAKAGGGMKAAALAGLAQRGAQALVAPGKKVIGGAFDAHGKATNAATLASNTLDLSNMQRPADYMKTLGKMQDQLPSAAPEIPVLPDMPKVASTRMAREGFGAMDRALRHVNNSDPRYSNRIINNAIKAWNLENAPPEQLAQFRSLLSEGNIPGRDQFTHLATSALSNTGLKPGQPFSSVPKLHPNTAAKLDALAPTLPSGLEPTQLLETAYKGELSKMQRKAKGRIDARVSDRMRALADAVTNKRSPFRDPRFRDVDAWEGPIGRSYRTQTSQVQAKNRRTTQEIGSRAQASAREATLSDIAGKDYSGVLDRYITHFNARGPK